MMLQFIVLYIPVGDHSVYIHSAVLRLHAADDPDLLDSHRNNRILCRILLYKKNLQCYSHRLMILRISW